MAGAIPVHTTTSCPSKSFENPLPKLLQTPSGLALLELQGTINLPAYDIEDDDTVHDQEHQGHMQQTSIGRLIFPEYDAQNPDNLKSTKRVYLYVGKHQRLTGEVKKLPKAFAVLRKRNPTATSIDDHDVFMEGQESGTQDELEIVEIVKWKILFSTRPEPVGALAAGP
ncbi:sister chromatid cohesion Ctf8 protein [Rutstroemia sp. NJR-2017a WRK4]|nr:sister chromatid cohesion Ctf8 protein [Rutstroemia sp. NJR-2017a WRK4]